MHELALADAVFIAALEAAEREGIASIRGIEVRIGELQRISPETFEVALEEVRPRNEPRLAQAVITLTVEPARFRCRPCGRAFALADGEPQDEDAAEAMHFIPELAHAFLACPACASPDFELIAGRGVAIGRIEGERA